MPLHRVFRAGPAGKAGLAIGLAGALSAGALVAASILRSTSSTAGIGFLLLPVYCVLAFGIFFLWGSGVGYLWGWLVTRPRAFGWRIILVLIATAGSAAAGIQWAVEGWRVLREVNRIAQVRHAAELDRIFRRSRLGRNRFVLGAIARNPAAPAGLLDGIARLPDPALHEKMGSLLPLLGENRKGLAVMRLVLTHPNVSPRTVEYLAATSPSEYVLGDAAGSPRASGETIAKLEARKNYLIDWGLARNRRTPPEILERLLNRKRHFTHRTTLRILLENPNLPEDLRARARALLAGY